MTNIGGKENPPAPGWEFECSMAARDRARRRLGGGARQQPDPDDLPFRRSRGKLVPTGDDDVIALRFQMSEERSREHR
jgi:hypothetical protein